MAVTTCAVAPASVGPATEINSVSYGISDATNGTPYATGSEAGTA